VAADVVGAAAGALAASITSGRLRRASSAKPQRPVTEVG